MVPSADGYNEPQATVDACLEDGATVNLAGVVILSKTAGEKDEDMPVEKDVFCSCRLVAGVRAGNASERLEVRHSGSWPAHWLLGQIKP